MSDTINQHYVPQFYLRNFSDNDKSVGMYILDSEKFVPIASIKEVFSKDYLYGKDNIMENNLRDLEGIWSQIISNILTQNNDNDLELSYRELSYLLMFISVSATRTLTKANEIDKQTDGLYKNILKYENKELYEEIKDKIEIKSTIPNWIPIESAKRMFMYLFDLDMAILNSYDDYGFISSDSPVIKYDQWLYRFGYEDNIGWVTKGLQIFLPISRNKCIFLYDDEFYGLYKNERLIEKSKDDINKIEKIPQLNLERKEDVDTINKLVIKNADRFLIIHGRKDYDYNKKLIMEEKDNGLSRGVAFKIHELPVGEILQFSDPNVKEYIPIPFCRTDFKRFEEGFNPNILSHESLIREFPKALDKFDIINRI